MKTPLISEPTGGQNQRRFLFCAFLCDFKAASFYRLWLTAFPEKIIEISAGAALLLSAKCNGIIFTLTLTYSKILELYSPRCITVQKQYQPAEKALKCVDFFGSSILHLRDTAFHLCGENSRKERVCPTFYQPDPIISGEYRNFTGCISVFL